MSDRVVRLLSGSRETCLRSKPATLDSGTPFVGEVVQMQPSIGRPRDGETKARTKHFWTVLAKTDSFLEALDRSRLDGRRMARLLDTPQGRAVLLHLCSQDIAA